LLDRMAGRLDETASRRHGHLLLLSGEAGAGKTTLLDAFRDDHRGPAVYWGTCDGIVPPRPFAPVFDIAASVGGGLQAALDAGDRDRVFEAFLLLLRRLAAGSIVVLEDLHWADDATLDLVRVIGRRLPGLPVLLVGTFRPEEVGRDHPLRLCLGDLARENVTELAVPALSLEAVGALAAGSGVDPLALHSATGGNAYFVTEALAGDGADLPATVRDAVLGRIARLSEEAQDVVRAASVLGPSCERDVLLDVAGHGTAELHECIERGLLEEDGSRIRFRHELAQSAVEAGLPHRRRTRLHARALTALRDSEMADNDRLAYHAAQANDGAAVLEFALPAGDRAGELGAHRTAAQHYAAALRFAGELDEPSRARLLERHAAECLPVDDAETALVSQRRALRLWRELGDVRAEGRALSDLSSRLWQAGDGDASLAAADEAVRLLHGLTPHDADLARAYARLAQRRLMAGMSEEVTRDAAERALALAEPTGADAVAVHALTTLGAMETYLGRETGWDSLERALRRAKTIGLGEEVGRILVNLVEAGRDLRRYEMADRYRDEALAHVGEHGVDRVFLEHRLLSDLAELDLDRGRWDEAERLAGSLLDRPRIGPIARVRALTVVGRLHARRGDRDPWQALDEADTLGVSDRLPLGAARVEAAWLEGDLPRARREAVIALAAAVEWDGDDPWWYGELAFWEWKAGGESRSTLQAAEPFVHHLEGRYAEAASFSRSIGSPYYEALALADSDGEDDLRLALELFHELGARPLARAVTRRLQAAGAHGVPRGPRPSTARNPRGLTPRELEVLTLVAAGLRNTEIADRLVLSRKTVDHHVSAILRKLEVPDRDAAAAEAARLGLRR
jgi:DNA-binding CsgD family transcriptional regulator/tetratricopeptide (TPR) repeat protein